MIAIATGLFNSPMLLTSPETHGASWIAAHEPGAVRISRGQGVRESFAPDRALTGERRTDLPGWVEPVASALADVLALRENWDSYGARRIDPAEVEGAFELLVKILDDDAPAPRIGPTGRGGVVIEWHQDGIDLEIETLSPHRFSVAFEDDKSSWEREIVSDFRPVVKALRRLV